MMEPCELPEMRPLPGVSKEPWAVTGMMGERDRRYLSSIYMAPPEEEIANFRMMRNWQKIQENEVLYKEYFMDDAEFAVIGFGSGGRIALSAVRAARAEGIKVGLLRPVTVAPFPTSAVEALVNKVKGILVTEMNGGQMLLDVEAVIKGRVPVEFYGRVGGIVPFPDEILAEIHRIAKGPIPTTGTAHDRWLDRMTNGK